MITLQNGDIVIASNGDRGIVAEDDILWAGPYHEKDDISFAIRYTETSAKITGQSQTENWFPDREIGSKGLIVLLAQTALKCKGYYRGNLDGDFGKMTFEAVRKFREDNYLTGDSILDTQTYKFLFQE